MVAANRRILVRHPNPKVWVGSLDQGVDLVGSTAQYANGTVEAYGLDGVSRVYVFEPANLIVSGLGPIQTAPVFSTAAANSWNSERNPYPG